MTVDEWAQCTDPRTARFALTSPYPWPRRVRLALLEAHRERSARLPHIASAFAIPTTQPTPANVVGLVAPPRTWDELVGSVYDGVFDMTMHHRFEDVCTRPLTPPQKVELLFRIIAAMPAVQQRELLGVARIRREGHDQPVKALGEKDSLKAARKRCEVAVLAGGVRVGSSGVEDPRLA